MKYTLKLTNPKGAVIINGRRFEMNTLGNSPNRADSFQYSCEKWALEDKAKFDAIPNLRVDLI